MKTVLFTYPTPVGEFWIQPAPAGRVQLGIDGHKLKTYGSPRAAALDVANRTTGWERWDTLDGAVVPRGLERWRRPSVAVKRKPSKRGGAAG